MSEQPGNPHQEKLDDGNWEWRFKFAALLATSISTLSLIFGGIAGLYTYHERTLKEAELKGEELRIRRYAQLKEVYLRLVDAAAAVGTASSKDDALKKMADFDRLYFGLAHIYVIDGPVYDAKIDFHRNVHKLIETEAFPSRKISEYALELSKSCRDALRPYAN